jgi:hypothetical protein
VARRHDRLLRPGKLRHPPHIGQGSGLDEAQVGGHGGHFG